MDTTETAPAEQAACWQLSDEQLAGALLDCESGRRRGYARMLGLVTEADRRGLAGALGYRTSAAWLSECLRISPHEARTRITHAHAAKAGAAVAGGEIAAPLPVTGAALAAGEIGAAHVHELDTVMRSASGRLDADGYAAAERHLVDLARQATPAAVRAAGRHLLAYLDQDGAPPGNDDPSQVMPRRRFRGHYTRDGWLRFDGELDPETATLLDGLFGVLAKPHPAETTGEPDLRGPDQRHGDALAEIIDLAARADDLATQGGERAVLTITVPLEILEQRVQAAMLDLPHGLTPAALRRLACNSAVLPAVLGGQSEVLDLGRAVRHATAGQRRALVLRDKGCAFPSCHRKPKWCTPHHILHWVHNGRTDVGNLVLLCARHHRIIHHGGWEVRITNGLPEFLPPAWLDSQRRPLRNHAHDPPGHRQAMCSVAGRTRDARRGRAPAVGPPRTAAHKLETIATGVR